MNTGLTASHLDLLRSTLARHPEVECAVIFGSRAKGTFRAGSDIDLALKGSGVTRRTVAAVSSELEDSSLPFFVDVIAYDQIDNAEMKSHVDRVGIPL